MAYRIENIIFALKRHRISSLLCGFTLAFSLVGNPTLIYTDGFRLKEIILFLSTLAVCYLFSTLLLFLLDEFHLKRRTVYIERSRKTYYIYICIGLGIIEGIYLLALNPGIVSWDAYYVIAEAKGLYPIQEYVGLLYIYLFSFLLNIVDSVWIIVYVQIIFAIAIIGYIASYFIKHNEVYCDGIWGIIIVYILVALPNNSSMIITLSKDVPWSLSFLLICFLIYELDGAKIGNKATLNRIYVLIVIDSFLVWMIRQNGWIIVPLVWFTLMAIHKDKCKMAIVCFLSFLLIVFGEVVTRIEPYEKTPGGMKYIAAFNDLEGIYENNGFLDQDTHNMILSVVPEGIEETYSPYWAYYSNWVEGLSDINVMDFGRSYIKTFLRNPLLALKMICLRLDMLYDISLGINGMETWQWQTYMTYEEWAFLVPQRNHNILTNVIEKVGSISLISPMKEFLWRAGLSLEIIIFMCIVSVLLDKRNVVFFLPVCGNILFYIMALSWSHYRYYWCLELLAILYINIFFDQKNKDEKTLSK